MKGDFTFKARALSRRRCGGSLDVSTSSTFPTPSPGEWLCSHMDFERFTHDVDILVTRDGLNAIHAKLEGLGYVPPFSGSKNLRDAEHGVRIEFLIAGEFPGTASPNQSLSRNRARRAS